MKRKLIHSKYYHARNRIMAPSVPVLQVRSNSTSAVGARTLGVTASKRCILLLPNLPLSKMWADLIFCLSPFGKWSVFVEPA